MAVLPEPIKAFIMSSPISTSAPNPIPGTSGGAGAIASVAAAAQNPVMQIDQRKIPVFHSKKDKDSLTIFDWCDRVDRMKDALDWNYETTFPNASAALFGVAQRTASNWAVLYKAEHRKTWTYLKKKMISHFGNMQSFIDAMFGIRQRTDTFDNLDKFNADVVDAFKVVREMLPQPDTPPPTSAIPEKSRSTRTSSTRWAYTDGEIQGAYRSLRHPHGHGHVH